MERNINPLLVIASPAPPHETQSFSAPCSGERIEREARTEEARGAD